MAVDKTPNFGFNTYDDHDEPGTGSKTNPSNGTNNNAILADALLALILNSDGTLKQNIIDKTNLKATVADGVTIVKDSSVGLKVVDGVFDEAGSAANVQTLLNTHKTSNDHDDRYLTIGYLSSIIRTTLDQVIDGIKTFLKNLRVKGDWPAYEMYDSDGNPLASVRAGKSSGKNRLDIILIQNGSAVNFLSMSEGGKVQMLGKDLATEEYVQARVKSGTMLLNSSTPSTQDTSNYTNDDFVIPNGLNVVRVVFIWQWFGAEADTQFITVDVDPVTFPYSVRHLRAKFENTNANGAILTLADIAGNTLYPVWSDDTWKGAAPPAMKLHITLVLG
ncbi:MAG: hypothetical protein H3C35_03740 [Bacteroidetes bacterium]|nr:hypothetical protein [Bacteroidota bacterium]